MLVLNRNGKSARQQEAPSRICPGLRECSSITEVAITVPRDLPGFVIQDQSRALPARYQWQPDDASRFASGWPRTLQAGGQASADEGSA